MGHLLVFDIGTTILKGGLFDFEGKPLIIIRQPLFSFSKKEIYNILSSSDFEPEKWISAIKQIISKIIKESSYKNILSSIKAIVISGNGPSLIPVSSNGKTLNNAIMWMDNRCNDYIKDSDINKDLDVDPTFFLSKAFWLFKKKKNIYNKTRYFLSCPEYISFFLTGNAFTFLPADGYTKYIWTDNAILKTGMERSKFPPFIPMGGTVGKVNKKAKDETQIPAGIPVFAGGPDFIMSLIGTGTVLPGRTCNRAGTSEGINYCSPHPVTDSGILCFPHIKKGLFNISSILPASGRSMDWFLHILESDHSEYKKLYSAISPFPVAGEKLIFLPHLIQGRSTIWSSPSRGALVGLSQNHGREAIFKAILEGTGFAVREIIELMENRDLHIKDIRFSGKHATVDIWNILRANITGKRLLIPEVSDSELTGCACVALYALGEYNNIIEASNKIVRIKKEYIPDKKRINYYNELFNLYKQSYLKLREVFKDLVKLNPD